MGDNPIAWNAMKERRKEEKQRRAIAEARKHAEKFRTENLTELPSQADFPMQETRHEWDRSIEENLKQNLYIYKRIHKCATLELDDALSEIG